MDTPTQIPQTNTPPVEPPPPLPTQIEKQKKSALPKPVVIIGILIILGGGLLYMNARNKIVVDKTDTAASTLNTNAEQNTGTTETSLANEGNNSNSWNTYTNSKNGYTLQYPSSWKNTALGTTQDTEITENSDSVDIQSPDLASGNVTLTIIDAKPEKNADQTETIDVFKNNAFNTYTSTTDNMMTKVYFIHLKNDKFLSITTRPVTNASEPIFESMLDSFQLL